MSFAYVSPLFFAAGGSLLKSGGSAMAKAPKIARLAKIKVSRFMLLVGIGLLNFGG
jgi:hypothetical protein